MKRIKFNNLKDGQLIYQGDLNPTNGSSYLYSLVLKKEDGISLRHIYSDYPTYSFRTDGKIFSYYKWYVYTNSLIE